MNQEALILLSQRRLHVECDVLQEKLSDSFRQASAKIGATIGLRVTEEDGTVTPVAPPPVEVADVHRRTPLSTAS